MLQGILGMFFSPSKQRVSRNYFSGKMEGNSVLVMHMLHELHVEVHQLFFAKRSKYRPPMF